MNPPGPYNFEPAATIFRILPVRFLISSPQAYILIKGVSMKSAFDSIKVNFNRYRREFLRYGLLLLIPLLLGCVLFVCVSSVTNRQLNENGESSVQRFRAEVYGVVREMQLVSDSIIADGTLDAAMTQTSAPEDPLAISHLLNSHISHSPYVSDVFLINQAQDHIYSSNAVFAYNALNTILQGITGEDAQALLTAEGLGWHVLNSNYTAPYYLSAFPGSDAMLLVTLDKTSFIRTLYHNDASLCCMFNEDFSIASVLGNYPETDWTDEDQVSQIAGEPVKTFYLEQDGFTYMTALSRSEYNAPLKVIIVIFSVYAALCLVFGMLYLSFLLRKRYDQAAAMIDGLPHGVTKNSTYEEIIRAMQQSLESYKQHYNSQLRFKTRNQIIALLLGAMPGADDAALEKSGLKKAEYGYYVALIHFMGAPGVAVNTPVPTNIDISCTVLHSALVKAAQDYMSIAIAHTERNYVAIISVTSPVVTKEDIRYILDETVLACESEYGSQIMALVSQPVSSAEDIQKAYRETVSLYDFARNAGSDISVLLSADMEEDAGVMLGGNFNKQLQLISAALEMSRYDMVPKLVDAILKEHVSSLGPYYVLANGRIAAVANLLAEAVAASNLSKDDALRYVSALQAVDSAPRLNDLTLEIVQALSRQPKSTAETDIVEKVCDLIRQNLADVNLSVTGVSEAVGVSMQHLSRSFRRKYNITVVEYINSQRIEKAKELIVKEGMTVNKVSEAVGYSNNVTFTRNFHRHVGMSPSEYREISK